MIDRLSVIRLPRRSLYGSYLPGRVHRLRLYILIRERVYEYVSVIVRPRAPCAVSRVECLVAWRAGTGVSTVVKSVDCTLLLRSSRIVLRPRSPLAGPCAPWSALADPDSRPARRPDARELGARVSETRDEQTKRKPSSVRAAQTRTTQPRGRGAPRRARSAFSPLGFGALGLWPLGPFGFAERRWRNRRGPRCLGPGGSFTFLGGVRRHSRSPPRGPARAAARPRGELFEVLNHFAIRASLNFSQSGASHPSSRGSSTSRDDGDVL